MITFQVVNVSGGLARTLIPHPPPGLRGVGSMRRPARPPPVTPHTRGLHARRHTRLPACLGVWSRVWGMCLPGCLPAGMHSPIRPHTMQKGSKTAPFQG